MSIKFAIGSDPELFLFDKEGKVVKAFDVIYGDKHNPTKTENGYVQWDNVLAEFNTNPSYSVQEFILNHKLVIKDLSSMLPDLSFKFSPSKKFKQEELEDPRARTAGCSVDYNAWLSSSSSRLAINRSASKYGASPYRVAGGHLHISFEQAEEDPMFEQRLNMVKALDLMLGVPSILQDSSPESKIRRKFYGKAGAFRPADTMFGKYDGIEYRVLSNYWVDNESIMSFIFSQVEKTVNNLPIISSEAIKIQDSIINCINNGDEKLADKICQDYKIVV